MANIFWIFEACFRHRPALLLNRKRMRTSISSNTAAAEEKLKPTNAKALGKSTIWDVRINHREQMVTVISECGLVMCGIVYIVFSASFFKRTIGNALN